MKNRAPARPVRWLVLSGLLVAAVGSVIVLASTRPAQAEPAAKPPVDFSRSIRPILSEYCFACHGPDDKHRKAKLRLDTREGAFAALRSGGVAIVAGKTEASELIARLVSNDPETVMPPPKSSKKLKPEQIELLRQWIEQGANWSEHWAFVTPKRPTIPAVAGDHALTPIDRFIRARLRTVGLEPSPEADRTVLIRRVTLDLTGLPPTIEELDAAMADTSADWYEKLVDRLLQSPRYGEHMARYWLDAARYGDTHGLHLDNYREMYPYRDWVINAFNRNLPFDRFIVEQLAGDLLPNPTLDQQIATGFNRCHVTTSEGGSIEEEVYVRNVVDQVETNGTVFFGMTFGCARCHDHKYDPFTMKDFYSFFAFFNSIDGKPLDGNAAQHPPVVKVATPEQLAALDRLNQKVAVVQQKIAGEVAKIPYDETMDRPEPDPVRRDHVWIDDALPPNAKGVSDGDPAGQWPFVASPQHPVFSGRQSLRRSSDGQSQHYFTDAKPGLLVGAGDVLFAYVYLDPERLPRQIMLQWNAGEWKHRAYWGENLINYGADNTPERLRLGELPEAGRWVRLEVPADKVGLKPGMTITGWAFTQFGGTVYWDRAGIVTATRQGEDQPTTLTAWLKAARANRAALPKPIQDVLKVDPAKLSKTQKQTLRAYFIENVYPPARAAFAPLHKELAEVAKERDQLDKQFPSTLVFKEAAQPRPAYILKRGEYDQRGDPVTRATPAFLPPLADDQPRNRLGLARWLVSPSHPLTSRVTVNRFWQQIFGTGLVKTAEDFGSQGEPPSHPELLDWLAVQFIEDGWNVKTFMKRLVMSATYRQSARVTKDRLAKDPANRLLSRGPRFRLDAETLRDQALFAGGMLIERVGGPSVKPPQPAGLWEAVGYTSSNTARFTPDTGVGKVHRRSLYTFWKRTSPPPQMCTFDAPSREACQVRRERTNTPLQALLLLNETQFVEAARGLAERTLKQAGTTEDRIAFLFRVVLSRKPDGKELTELVSLYSDHLARYNGNPDAARKLIAIGETKPDATLNPGELAAWTMLANLVLNLDEALTK